MKTWNNTRQQLPNGNYTVTDWWDDILDNVEEGDEVINGGNVLYICTRVRKHPYKKQNDFVWLHYAKKDRTPHNGHKAEKFLFSDERHNNPACEWKQV